DVDNPYAAGRESARPDVGPVVGKAHVVCLVPFGAEIELVYDCSVFRRRYVYVHDGDKVVVLLVGVEGHDVEIFFGRRQIVYERRMADLGAYGARCDKNRRKN